MASTNTDVPAAKKRCDEKRRLQWKRYMEKRGNYTEITHDMLSSKILLEDAQRGIVLLVYGSRGSGLPTEQALQALRAILDAYPAHESISAAACIKHDRLDLLPFMVDNGRVSIHFEHRSPLECLSDTCLSDDEIAATRSFLMEHDS